MLQSYLSNKISSHALYFIFQSKDFVCGKAFCIFKF